MVSLIALSYAILPVLYYRFQRIIVATTMCGAKDPFNSGIETYCHVQRGEDGRSRNKKAEVIAHNFAYLILT